MLFVWPLSACGKGSEVDTPRKVVILGLDGAEWSLLQPMIDAGEMPHLASLAERGASGTLKSLEPPQKSPAIWTTIATGKSPDDHGIRTFVDKVRGRPLTRNLRQVPALWNIASSVGLSSGVVGWLMSWPAEEIRGFVVSDYLQYSAAPSRRLEHRTFPAELAAELAVDVMPWQQVPWSFVQGFLDAPLDPMAMSAKLRSLLQPIRWISAGDMTFARIGTKLYREHAPGFFAVYLRGMDAMGHLYWNYMTPEAIPEGSLSAEGSRYLSGAVRAYYRYTDKLIGQLLDEIDEKNTTIIVVSDHGFKGGKGRGIEMHTPDGVIVIAGPKVKQGRITGATVYDVAPSVLVLLGLPPADDMPGRVLWSAFNESLSRDQFSATIPTYGTSAPVDSVGRGTVVDEEVKDRLRTLGYVD